MEPLEVFLAFLGAFLLLEVSRSHAEQLMVLRRKKDPPPLDRHPSVTVIRPIKGVDTGLADNVRAAFQHGYSGPVETIFVFDDAREPAYPIVRDVLAEEESAGRAKPGEARVLFCGAPPRGRTGKLHAMIAGLRDARHELIAFADSDLRPDPGVLEALVATLLASQRAGAAFAPVVVTEAPETAGDVGYAVLINGLYGPETAAAVKKHGGELPFIMGQFMVWRREAIAAIGGLECADGQLVDDMYLGQQVIAAGWRNVVSPRPIAIIQRGLKFGDFIGVFIRWIAFSRSGLPVAAKLGNWIRGGEFWVGIVAAGVAAMNGFWGAAVLCGLVPLAIGGSINCLHRAFGGAKVPLRWWGVAPLLLFVGPAVYLEILLRREVNWRGRVYKLNRRSTLASSES